MAVLFRKKGEGWFLLNVCGCSPPAQFFAKSVLTRMRDGNILEVVSDNPCCAESIVGMCEARGDEILEQDRRQGMYRFKIRKLDLQRAA
ncbi:MAG: hypothetical protein A2X52_09175 [Candidatus Rokubacteria bacterium GWC2_70_16]|nr:MAG: hypothetical protein A2X52_09175 [Candidatus Rokubacteria bacterium GWC2_70_16]OGL16214.1 MAG: hypothetical protein A3K12_07180 [Candidatus Rokubacteria bacterium RIFCSPLOWO2_12_FULL_71_19]